MTIVFDTEAPERETATIFAPQARTIRVIAGTDRHEAHIFDVHADYPERGRSPRLLPYAASRTRELVTSGQLAPRAAIRGLETLQSLAMPGMVFPHISVAEGEFVALWLAGRVTIELSIPAEGPIYARTTGADGREELVGFFEKIPVAELRRSLRALSTSVARENPNWRIVFEQ